MPDEINNTPTTADPQYMTFTKESLLAYTKEIVRLTRQYVDTKISGTDSKNVDEAISAHNIDGAAHADIRKLVSDLTTKVDAFLDVDDGTMDQLSELVKAIKDNKDLIQSATTDKVDKNDMKVWSDDDVTSIVNEAFTQQSAEQSQAAIKSDVSEAVTTPREAGYAYKADMTIDGNAVSANAKDANYLTQNNDKTVPATADLAQFLGSIYDKGDVKTIGFEDVDYTWKPAEDGTYLKGSNWRDANGTTLVNKIVSEYIAGKRVATLTLKNDITSTDITYTITPYTGA